MHGQQDSPFSLVHLFKVPVWVRSFNYTYRPASRGEISSVRLALT